MLVKIPALIDPHVHFRYPGDEHKEDWKSATMACLHGGITRVCDMPNNKPPAVTLERLIEKKRGIDALFSQLGFALKYHLYLGAHQKHFDEIDKVKGHVCGIKVFMGSSTGDLLIDQDNDLDIVFQKAARSDLLVAVHAEDESYLKERKKMGKEAKDHSWIRDPQAAAIAVEKAIFFAKKHGTRLYLLHISSEAELQIIRKAKTLGLSIFAETTPHHLFLTTNDYEHLHNFAVVNPPLRSPYDQDRLWEALLDGTIDTIGTDHAPHTIEEKKLPYGSCPSGVPGLDTFLPLLLTAHHQKRISLDKIIELTHRNPAKIFRFEASDDYVMIDLEEKRELKVSHLHTKCGWSPFLGKELVGWPVSTHIQGKTFSQTKGWVKE